MRSTEHLYSKEKIRGRQAELGLKSQELAEKAGVNINTITAIRSGKPVNIASLAKVVEALELEMAEMFPHSDSNPSIVVEAA